MPFNLIDEPWLPARRLSGAMEWIQPWRVSDFGPENDDPFTALAAARPDFNGALTQFLIGLAQTLWPPLDEKAWRVRIKNPPDPEELRLTFSTVKEAFNLDGPGPRFMQDLDPLAEAEPSSIHRLFIEQPGEKTLTDNADHFVHRGQVTAICLPCAAQALFTLQTNAPSGGAGVRTGLRGGGPLTTLALGQNLWQTVWLNVLTEPDFLQLCPPRDHTAPADRFPWLGPTRTSEKGQQITPLDAAPDQYFWATPRRLRLDFDRSAEEGICDLCGRVQSRLVTAYRTKPYGDNYKGGWRHPLTPYYKNKDEYLPVHGQPGSLAYRDFLGLVLADPEEGRLPAAVISRYVAYVTEEAVPEAAGAESFRVWAFGYDMDNMKARGWSEAVMPLVLVPADRRQVFEDTAAALIRGADYAAWVLLQAIKKAWFSPRAKTRDPAFIRPALCEATEPGFYQTLGRLKAVLTPDSSMWSQEITDLKLVWLSRLREEALSLFDRHSQADQIEDADPKRIALARRDLRLSLAPGGKKVIKTLLLPQPPESPQPASSKKRR
ncbi:MAG: type I-E CRISPR-associated protein Cse1/CasA [Thermodesulfobacteriota bacterium]